MSNAKPLSPKLRRFIAEYLKDQNGKYAAIRAGYSKKTAEVQACQILARPAIRAIVEGKLLKHEITADKVIAELGRLAFSDLRHLYKEDGALKPVNEWPEDIARSVAGLESEEIFEGFGQDRRRVGDLRKVKLWAKPQALEILARHFKLLTDKIEHSGNLTIEQLLGESRA